MNTDLSIRAGALKKDWAFTERLILVPNYDGRSATPARAGYWAEESTTTRVPDMFSGGLLAAMTNAVANLPTDLGRISSYTEHIGPYTITFASWTDVSTMIPKLADLVSDRIASKGKYWSVMTQTEKNAASNAILLKIITNATATGILGTPIAYSGTPSGWFYLAVWSIDSIESIHGKNVGIFKFSAVTDYSVPVGSYEPPTQQISWRFYQ
jgi:hypothetical protein